MLVPVRFGTHLGVSSPKPKQYQNGWVWQWQVFLSFEIERKQKGGFEKGRFWRMCPRSGFWSRGTSACTLAPSFGKGNIRMYPRSGFRYRGTSECTLVPVFGTGEHTSAKTTLLRDCDENLAFWCPFVLVPVWVPPGAKRGRFGVFPMLCLLAYGDIGLKF